MADLKRYTSDCALGPFLVKAQKSQSHIFSPTLWTPLLFLFLAAPPSASSVSAGLRAFGEDSVSTAVKGILGESVTFPLNISVSTEIEHVAWSRPQIALVLAYPGGQVTFLAKSYQSRLSISNQSYSLHISNLTLKDAGLYRAQINRNDFAITTEEKFILYIYEKLKKPQVTFIATMSESASCNLTLICSVEGPGQSVVFSWIVVSPHASESCGGSTLTISWKPCDPDLVYICTAKNPVSNSSSFPVRAQEFCADPGASRGGTMEQPVIGVLGESVTFPLMIPASQDIKKVVWMSNTFVISKDLREAATEGPTIKSKEPNEDPMWLFSEGYSLKISQLKMEDAGTYTAYLCSETPRVTSTKQFTLHIYRRLEKPKITWSPRPPEGGICRATLTCSVEDSGDDVTYRWIFQQKGAVVFQEGSFLNVSWRSTENHPNFTCIATNPISNSSWEFLSGNICPGPVESMKYWPMIFLVIPILLCFGIFGWYLWKQKELCSASSFPSSQVEPPADAPGNITNGTIYTMLSQGYEKLDTSPKTLRQRPRPASDNSSDSNLTTEENEERTKMQKPVSGMDAVYDLVTQEDTAFEGQTEYDLVTPDNMALESVVEGNTVYAQVFLNLPGKTVPQRNDNLPTIYCSIQKSQLVGPPLQQNDDSPENSAYENFT
ncbi:T-lymphocyte surface antigen Ly-9 [Orycteropus afer afer]|uniref:T-lymphocyte surface antigen Ly-9 n=1 Tax=Orycteropus afer afer TaxID=1230840 RepID=A0AC54ZAH7_ORYAF|nr:T-lymphocyte surface antigen Ly-9 [Orycteropus afer afer]